MIYPKFPQRYLATIVLCFILTLTALGAIFLIYLFNANRTPLLLTGGTGAHDLESSSNYIYDKDIVYGNNEQRQQILQYRSNYKTHMNHSFPINAFDQQRYVSSSRKQQHQTQQRNGSLTRQQQSIQAPTASAKSNNSNVNMLMEEPFGKLRHIALKHSVEIADSVVLDRTVSATDEDFLTEKDIDAESVGELQLPLERTAFSEQYQLQLGTSRENYDTIYIDDYERQSKTSPHLKITKNQNYLNGVDFDESHRDAAFATVKSLNTSSSSKKMSRYNTRGNNKHKQHLLFVLQKPLNITEIKSGDNNKNVVMVNTAKQVTSANSVVSNNFDLDVDGIHAGSGSGDYDDDSDDSDDDYDFETAVGMRKRINFPLWRDNIAAISKLKQKQKLRKQLHNKQNNIRKKLQPKQRHFMTVLLGAAATPTDRSVKLQQKIYFNIDSNLYSTSREIVSNLSTEELFNKDDAVDTTVTTKRTKNTDTKSTNSSSNSFNNHINKLTSVRHKMPITSETIHWPVLLPFAAIEDDIGLHSQLAVNDTLDQNRDQKSPKQQHQSRNPNAAEDITMASGADNSVAWLETRTRRVMGNVKKSEERSRQLLLCEEAGGGELCRMLFKGNLSD